MNLLVYNRHNATTDLSLEAFGIRLGLLLADYTFAIGETGFYILYKERMMKMKDASRLKTLAKAATTEEQSNALTQAIADLKFLRNKKNKGQRDIVFMKQTEHFLHECFELHVDDSLSRMNKFSLHQLAALNTNEQSGLRLWYADKDAGEKDPKYELSELLSCKLKEDSIKATDVLTLVGSVSDALLNGLEMTTLCELPNINSLNSNQVLSVREQLAPLRKELNELIPLTQPAENETAYCTGTWNLEGLKEFSVRLQRELDEVPELQWSANLQKGIRPVVKVGIMETPALWQLLHDHELLPDDTWEVLSKWIASGSYFPTTPIMTFVLPDSKTLARYLTEEETLVHKRKTIDLD